MKVKIYNFIPFAIAGLLSNFSHAQLNNNSNLFIGDGGNLYISGGNYLLGSNGYTQTSRTPLVYGKLILGSTTTIDGATDVHNVNGYLRTVGKNSFTYPVGDVNILAPIRVVASAAFNADAAYFNSNPTAIGTTIQPTLTGISNSEYWNIVSTNGAAKVSLSYRNTSNVGVLTTADLSKLTIAGWNGVAWVRIPSTVDITSITGEASSINSGSITTDTNISLAIYKFFTLAAKGDDCLPLITSSGNVKTFNGLTWSPSLPSIEDPVVINGDYSGIGFECNSLTLNANINLANNQVIEIVNDVTGTGKIIMASDASVIQRNPMATAPTIEMTKITNPMRRFDYVFVSSPINNAVTFFNDLKDKNKTAVNGNFGNYPASAFNVFTTYNEAGLASTPVTNANVGVGKGFSAMVGNSAPYSDLVTAAAWFTQKFNIHIKTTGVTNNGNVPISIPANAWARVGNPYPSPIDGQELLDALGSSVRKTLYYWTFNSPRQTLESSAGMYNSADFATWNFSGGVSVCPTCDVPDGKITTMQSVIVRSVSPTITNSNLTNCMRINSSANSLLKASSNVDRFWLNLTGSNGSFSQTLLAYREEGTLGFDEGFDAPKMGGVTSSQLTSLIGTSRYAIQTRPSFFSTDEVPLQVDQVNAETLTLSLGNKEGIFNSGEVAIYLHDTMLNTYHNLLNGNYTYLPTTTTDNSRFKIVYQQALSNDDFSTNTNVIAVLNNENLRLQASNEMELVEIFDITGRKIQSITVDNQTIISEPFFHEEGVYIAKVKLLNGTTVSKKLINKK